MVALQCSVAAEVAINFLLLVIDQTSAHPRCKYLDNKRLSIKMCFIYPDVNRNEAESADFSSFLNKRV